MKQLISFFFHIRLLLVMLFTPNPGGTLRESFPRGTVYGPLATAIRANQKVGSQVYDGRVKYLKEIYTQGATIGDVGDVIELPPLPVGAMVIGHLSTVTFSTGTTNSTLSVGKTGAATALKAATAIDTAGTFTLIDPASGADDVTLAAGEKLIATNATAGIKAGQVIAFRIAYVVLN